MLALKTVPNVAVVGGDDMVQVNDTDKVRKTSQRAS